VKNLRQSTGEFRPAALRLGIMDCCHPEAGYWADHVPEGEGSRFWFWREPSPRSFAPLRMTPLSSLVNEARFLSSWGRSFGRSRPRRGRISGLRPFRVKSS